MMDGEQCLGAAGGSSPPLSRKQKAARGTLAKIDSVFSSVQALEAMSNLLEDCCSYLETQHQKEGGVKATVVNPLQLPCDCLRVAIDGLDKHASIISQAIVNTSETKEVKYAQRKLMKSQSKNYAQQFNTNEVMMERDPKSALTSSLNFAKQSLDDILSRTSPDFIVPAVTAAKKKRKQSTLVEKPESATDGQAVGGARKKQKQLDGGGGGESKEIIDVIDLPQPMEGQIMYSPLETVSYIGNIIDNNPGKSYVKAYKDKLIAEKRIPIQKTQLNLLLKQYSASGGDGKSMAPLSWNERGVREAGLETLLAQFQAKQSKGGSWSIDDTRDALRRESKEEGPTEGVIESRHAMLTSLRKYQNHTAEQISMQELRLKEKPPTIPARRRKKQENQKSPSSLSTTRLKDRFDKNDKKYNHIKLPTPLGGFLYTPSEAVANIINYIESKPTPSRGDVRAFKEKMIAERVVPISISQLNYLVQQHGGENKEPAPKGWSLKGREEIMSIEVLVQRVDDSQSIWTIENTREAIWAEKQRKFNEESQRKGDGTPVVEVKAPDKKTVHGYHTALLSIPQIAHKVAKPEVIRIKPGPKPRNQEAIEN